MKKKEAKTPSGLKRILGSALLLLVLTAVLCALYALLVMAGTAGQGTAAPAASVLLGVAALITAWQGSRRLREKRLQTALLSAAAALAVLLLIRVLFLPAGMAGAWVNAAVVLGATLLGCLLAGTRPRGAKHPAARRRR